MLTSRTIVAVVDDDPSMLNAAEDLLHAQGFATMVFASAEEFLDRGVVTQVDCLLLDIHLGGMSGIELRRRLNGSGSIASGRKAPPLRGHAKLHRRPQCTGMYPVRTGMVVLQIPGDRRPDNGPAPVR